jgi:putative membrane protein
VFAVAFALGLSAGAGAAQAASSAKQAAPALNAQQLVPTLHRINAMEIDAGKMAQTKGSTTAMKDYGAKLERDHQAADRNLTDYAKQAKVDINGSVPGAVTKTLQHAQQEMNGLRNEQGPTFDRRFAEQMVRDHKAAIGLVDRSKTRIEDPRLQALLAELVPTLQSHEQIAANLLSEMPGVSSNEKAAPPASAQGRRPGTTR